MARKRVIDIPDPELSDDQWAKLAPLLPEPQPSPHGGPKPVPNRPVVEGILWVLRNGGRWKALPRGYPSPATCWRRLAAWAGFRNKCSFRATPSPPGAAGVPVAVPRREAGPNRAWTCESVPP